MSHGYVVAVVGATGCLGREVIARLHDMIPVLEVIPFATRLTAGERIEVQGSSVVVKGLSDEGFDDEILSRVHLVVFACPGSIVLHHAPILSDEGIAVLDFSGAMGATIGFSAPNIAEREEDFMAHRMISVASPTSMALAVIWAALQPFQPVQVSSSVSVSASRFGQKGIEELAHQVRALLNLQDSPHTVFPDGLAFDLLPSIGGDEDGQSVAEQVVSNEVADLLLIEPHQVRNRIQVAPIFSGISLHLQVSCHHEPLFEEVVDGFEQAAGIDFRQQLPNLRSIMGDTDVFVGRVDVNPWIRGIELQAQVDNVAFAVHSGLKMIQRYHEADLL